MALPALYIPNFSKYKRYGTMPPPVELCQPTPAPYANPGREELAGPRRRLQLATMAAEESLIVRAAAAALVDQRLGIADLSPFRDLEVLESFLDVM